MLHESPNVQAAQRACLAEIACTFRCRALVRLCGGQLRGRNSATSMLCMECVKGLMVGPCARLRWATEVSWQRNKHTGGASAHTDAICLAGLWLEAQRPKQRKRRTGQK